MIPAKPHPRSLTQRITEQNLGKKTVNLLNTLSLFSLLYVQRAAYVNPALLTHKLRPLPLFSLLYVQRAAYVNPALLTHKLRPRRAEDGCSCTVVTRTAAWRLSDSGPRGSGGHYIKGPFRPFAHSFSPRPFAHSFSPRPFAHSFSPRTTKSCHFRAKVSVPVLTRVIGGLMRTIFVLTEAYF